MTEAQLFKKFNKLDRGFTISERVSINDVVELLKHIEQKLFTLIGDGTYEPTLSTILPDDLPIGDQLGLDYLTYKTADDEDPRQLIFSISWEDASWELFEGIFVIEGFNLLFNVLGSNVSVVIEGSAHLEDFELSLSLELPSFMLQGTLANSFDEQPSPLQLLDRFKSLPSTKKSSGDKIKLKDLSIAANPPARSFFMNLELSDLHLGPVEIDTQMQLNYSSGDIMGFIWGTFEFAAGGKNYLIGLKAAHPGPQAGWVLEGGLSVTKLNLIDLLDYLARQFNVPTTDELGFDTDVLLKYVFLSIDTGTHHYNFTVDFEIDDPIKADLQLSFDLVKSETGDYNKEISGELTLGNDNNSRVFDLVFSNTKSSAGIKKQLLALYRKPGGEKIPLRELLAAVAGDQIDAIPDLEFKIMNAMLVLLKEPSGIKKYLFTSEMDFGLDLSGLEKLPLIGKALPKEQSLKINFQPIISPKDIKGGGSPNSKKLDKGDLKDIKAIIPEGGPPLPDELDGGLGLMTTIQMGGLKKQLELGIGADQVDDDLGNTQAQEQEGFAPSGALPAGPSAPAGQTVDDDKIKWIDLSKSFGPVYLSRVGIGYQNNQIDALLDGSIALGPIEIALLGLGAHYRLSDKHLSFSLDGLGMHLSKDPLEISGAFLRMEDDFVGRVSIKLKTLGITALGAYGEHDGHPSLFLYAFLDYPIGGPVFFFLEGLAFGFGFNRRLIVPPIGEMYKFPLVAEAMGKAKPAPGLDGDNENFAVALKEEFTMLQKYIPAETGQYFLAVGIKFSSFKTLENFALLVVNFGQQFDIGILGISRLSVPNTGNNDAIPKVAVVEMAFSVRFVPAEGFLGVEARLTPNSYLYSPFCKLQGGFAFYSWFDGEHAGDFVVTLGGYHPAYKPEKHYPQAADVPRLGFNWRLNDNIYIKGEAYFALTPKAMMLGGRLEAQFNLDEDEFSVNAWFIAKADFLVYWKPFHYEASISVEIGCRLVIHVLCNASASLNAGSALNIWGPEFAGTANVHAKVLGIKINFDIEFGDTKPQSPPRISWEEFKASFLPNNPETAALSINIQKGFIKSVKEGNKERWVVNSKEMVLAFNSVVPVTKAPYLYDRKSTRDNWSIRSTEPIRDLQQPVTVAIDPVGITKDNFSAHPNFRIVRDNVTQSPHTILDEFVFIPINKRFPKALWTDDLSSGSKPGLNGEQMIELTGGYLLMPKKPPKSQATHAFPVRNLEFDQTPRPLKKDGAKRPKYFLDKNPLDKKSQIRVRKAALAALGFDPKKEVKISTGLNHNFLYEPLMVNVK